MSGAMIMGFGTLVGFAVAGVGGWLVETGRIKLGQRTVLAGLVVVAAAIGAGAAFDAIQTEPFNLEWIAKHCKTCEQCDESFNRNPDVPVCDVMFRKLQEAAK